MNRKHLVSTSWPRWAAILCATALLASCTVFQTPPPPGIGEVTSTPNESPIAPTTASTDTPMPNPTGLKNIEAGVAIRYRHPDRTSLQLLPVDQVIAARDLQTFSELTKSKPDGNPLAGRTGCVVAAVVVPDNGEDPTEIYYAPPAISGLLATTMTVTATAWSEYSAYAPARPEGETNAPLEITYVVSPPLAIDSVLPFTPVKNCNGTLAESLDQLQQETGGWIDQADRLLLSIEEGGGRQSILVIFQPSSGAGCNWVLSQCSGCDQCGYGGICAVAIYLCQ